MAKLPDELIRLVEMIENEELRNLVREFMENPEFKLSGIKVKPPPLEEGSGSRGYHHSYRGGLLDHIIACTKLGLALCHIVKEVYGCDVDKDVVLASTLLHDLYKTVVYEDYSPSGFSEIGERIDHHTLIVSELIRRGFPIDVIHCVLAMHGRYGPFSPKTIEALIAHLADTMDSTLCDEILKAAKSLVKKAVGVEPEIVTARDAFDIVRTKQKGGWEALKKRYAVETKE